MPADQPPRRSASAPRTPSSCWPKSPRSPRRARTSSASASASRTSRRRCTCRRRRIRAIREGKHGYTPSAGIDPLREAAAKYMAGMRGGLPIRPQDVVVGAGAKPFIAYAILSTTDHGAGDEVIYPNPGFPIYESQIVAYGAKPVPLHLREARDFAFDPAELEATDHAEDEAADPQLPRTTRPAASSTAPDLEAIAAILQKHPAGLGLRRRDLLAPVLRGRVLLHRAAARHVRAHHHFRRRLEDLGDDRLAHRLRLQPGARAGVHALDHQHRLLRLADLAVGGARGDQRPAGRRRDDEEELSRAPGSDRRPAERGARA